ncbi:hypothetical protein JB92DRAFT_3135966 [Gautieria morchelliformis]|nr:hypothetical protein JB92DRAFT_3135966 [Gautieria morchelliformis]
MGFCSVLGNEAAELPSNFHVLITSHAKKDIQDALRGKKHILSKSIKEIDPNPDEDISLFVQAQLGNIPALEQKWPNKAWCRLIVEKSEGHFQWASMACRFVKGGGKGGRIPVKQLEEPLVKNLTGMENLYLGILKQIFRDGDALTDDVKHRFHLVMGCILTAREPLSMSAPQKLCNGDDSGTEVHAIVGPMGVLLSLPTQDSDPISLLHTSFCDFLTDCNQSGPYYIDTLLHHRSGGGCRPSPRLSPTLNLLQITSRF